MNPGERLLAQLRHLLPERRRDDVLASREPAEQGGRADSAGEADAVGPGVDGYAVGDRVFGVVTKPYLGDGSFAEYVTVPAEVGIAKLPDGISFTDGAALGVAGATAYAVIEQRRTACRRDRPGHWCDRRRRHPGGNSPARPWP
ncbi:hypothetical protein OG394_10010 [Kribbella sp. NBC_01245]|uniref:alcohol dehydrogenase catalytic domain-containing protein n=1 Tax=Kribbella sp. NBC_01245 TaxID=2903578 RepID=UPI002E29B37B|nr:hypothetical protein [Kribbella sp. NBC_01245]